MNWRHIGFDWNHARAFLATAEEGSFSAAARALGVAQPTIGRQIAALEEELGVDLFERVGRAVRPTSVGLDLAEHVRAMRAGAERVALTAAGQAMSLEGAVSIAASEVIAAYLLPPIFARARAAHPALEILGSCCGSDPSWTAALARRLHPDERARAAGFRRLDALAPVAGATPRGPARPRCP